MMKLYILLEQMFVHQLCIYYWQPKCEVDVRRSVSNNTEHVLAKQQHLQPHETWDVTLKLLTYSHIEKCTVMASLYPNATNPPFVPSFSLKTLMTKIMMFHITIWLLSVLKSIFAPPSGSLSSNYSSGLCGPFRARSFRIGGLLFPVLM